MVAPSVGSVVLVPFPFSDLSQSKLRPAVVLADAGRRRLDSVSGNQHSISRREGRKARESDFEKGSPRIVSYARPGKLFTANQQLLVSEVGSLNDGAFNRRLDAVVGVLRPAGK